MATSTYAAFAIGPIAFYDQGTGKHISVPLTDITFNGTTVSVPTTVPTGVSQAAWTAIADWIAYLASVGVIVPTTVSATPPTTPIA
jgi:hypothetical protein